tara:strand:- start:2296 stop:2766 length:471 start_codon:yes stop_codon:yes gene_type:complete
MHRKWQPRFRSRKDFGFGLFKTLPVRWNNFISFYIATTTMPLFELRTNQRLNEEEVRSLVSEISCVCSEILRKPEKYVMVDFQMGQSLIFAGTDDPAAFGKLHSINLPLNETATLSAQLCSFLSERLHVPQERIYLSFVDVERNKWGWNGQTFGSS